MCVWGLQGKGRPHKRTNGWLKIVVGEAFVPGGVQEGIRIGFKASRMRG